MKRFSCILTMLLMLFSPSVGWGDSYDSAAAMQGSERVAQSDLQARHHFGLTSAEYRAALYRSQFFEGDAEAGQGKREQRRSSKNETERLNPLILVPFWA